MKIILILHDVRSLFNIGSLIRTADGFGVSKIYATGLTPYLIADNETRPPHVRDRAKREMHKTALGAENSLPPTHHTDISELLVELKRDNFQVVGLEQTPSSASLYDFKPTKDIALVLGSETEGLPDSVQSLLDTAVEIPMLGKKESFNVTIAAAIALYELRRNTLY